MGTGPGWDWHQGQSKRENKVDGQAKSGAALTSPSFPDPVSGVYLHSFVIKGDDGEAGIRVQNKSPQDVP